MNGSFGFCYIILFFSVMRLSDRTISHILQVIVASAEAYRFSCFCCGNGIVVIYRHRLASMEQFLTAPLSKVWAVYEASANLTTAWTPLAPNIYLAFFFFSTATWLRSLPPSSSLHKLWRGRAVCAHGVPGVMWGRRCTSAKWKRVFGATELPSTPPPLHETHKHVGKPTEPSSFLIMTTRPKWLACKCVRRHNVRAHTHALAASL